MDRREFLKKLFYHGSSLFLLGLSGKTFAFNGESVKNFRRASFYTALSGKTVRCELCFRQCVIKNKKRGFCKTRENRNGELYTLTYNRPVAIHIDPVEKIPLLHFFPGTDVLCIGTAGCNLRCLNCINWHFAQKTPEEVESLTYSPEDIVNIALDKAVNTICFTYNEPAVCFEYMLDVFKLAHNKGIKTTLHSNASMNRNPLQTLLPYVDAVVADLKALSNTFYKENCSARLDPVLSFLMTVKNSPVWLEVVNLLIPGKNDTDDEIKKLCKWVLDNLGADIPVQFSRFFPTYKLSQLPPTPVQRLKSACELGSKMGLQYVYVGNVPGIDRCNTYCPGCRKLLVERKGILIKEYHIKDNKCKFCSKTVKGLWK